MKIEIKTSYTITANTNQKMIKDLIFILASSIAELKRCSSEFLLLVNIITNNFFQIIECVFVGDALFDGGNDSSVKKTSINLKEVSGPKDLLLIFQNKFF